MGQKVNPNSIRLGITKTWDAQWYPSDKKDFAKWLVEDNLVRTYFRKVERKYGIGRILIQRVADGKLIIDIFTSRPGAVLGKEAKNKDAILLDLHKIIKDRNRKIELNISEIKKPDLNARLVANEIAIALENRVPFRIIQKKMIARVMRSGASGVKTQVSGRLNGVDMARSEGYSRGTVPLQTFRNDIDYHHAEANTTYGVLGVKVWISKSEILKTHHNSFEGKDKKPPFNRNKFTKSFEEGNQ